MNDKGISLKKNIFWNSIGNITYLFLQWLITIVIVRVTTYREAGIYALAVSLTNALYGMALWGVRNYQVSDINNKYSDGEYVIARCLTCFMSFSMCIFIILINSYSWEQNAAIIINMLFHIGEAYVDVLHGIEQKASRMDFIGKSFLLRGIASFTLFTIALFYTKNIIISTLVRTSVTLILIYTYDWKMVFKINNTIKVYLKKNVYNLLKESFVLAIYTIVISAIATVPRYYLEKIYGQDILGIYATIATPAVIIQAAIGYIMAPIIAPISVCYVTENKKKLLNYIKVTIIGIITFSLICILAAIYFGNFALNLIFGKDILAYAYLLLPVLLATIFTAISLLINTLLTIFRDFKGLLISNFVGLFCSITLSNILITKFCLNGTSITHIISMAIQALIGGIFVYNAIKNMGGSKHNRKENIDE